MNFYRMLKWHSQCDWVNFPCTLSHQLTFPHSTNTIHALSLHPPLSLLSTFFNASIVFLLGVMVPSIAIMNGGLRESLLSSASPILVKPPRGPSVLSWNCTVGRSPTVLVFLIFGEHFKLDIDPWLSAPIFPLGMDPLMAMISGFSLSGFSGSCMCSHKYW